MLNLWPCTRRCQTRWGGASDLLKVGAKRVADTRMVVIGLGGREDGANAGALERDGQAVDEGVVGRRIRSEEELPLGAAAGDHVGAARQDFAWE